MQQLELWQIAVRRALLNHADLDDLYWHRRLLTPLQRDLLDIVQAKIERNPDWFARKGQDYSQTAGLVLMSSWGRIVDFCTCMVEDARREYGLVNDKRRALNCRCWRLCDHDAWRRQMDLQCRFLSKFSEGLWYSLTASFTGNLPMVGGNLQRNNPPVSHADLIVYWDAIRSAVAFMTEAGVFRGAVLTEELHLESLYPWVLVTPHTHVLVLANDVLGEVELARFQARLQQFKGSVIDWGRTINDDEGRWGSYHVAFEKWKLNERKTKPRLPQPFMKIDSRLRLELPISLDCKVLPTQADFARRISYQMKPHTLAKLYEKSRAILLRENPEGLEFLTQNVNDFIVMSDLLLTPRRSPAYYGSCDARRPVYKGNKGYLLDDQDHRAETKALLKSLNADADSPCAVCGYPQD